VNRTVKADHGASPVSKLVQVLLSENHGPGIFQAAYNFSILGRNPILEQSAGSRGAYTGGVNDVFQRQRYAMQRSAPLTSLDLGFSLARLSQRGFGGYGDEGVQRAIQFLNPG
jgi:hypothetical protein